MNQSTQQPTPQARSTRAPWGRRLIAAALLSLLLVALIDSFFGADVIVLIRQHDETERAQAQASYDPRDPVAELYGLPESLNPLRVILWDHDPLIRPSEAPDQVLLFLDRPAGQQVLEARSVWIRVGLVALPLALVGAWLVLGARRRNAPGSGHEPAESPDRVKATG